MQPTSGSSIFYFQVDLGNSQLYWLFLIYTKKLFPVHFMYGGKTNHDVIHFAAGPCEENVYLWILWIYVTVGIICKVTVRYLSVIISSYIHDIFISDYCLPCLQVYNPSSYNQFWRQDITDIWHTTWSIQYSTFVKYLRYSV